MRSEESTLLLVHLIEIGVLNRMEMFTEQYSLTFIQMFQMLSDDSALTFVPFKHTIKRYRC